MAPTLGSISSFRWRGGGSWGTHDEDVRLKHSKRHVVRSRVPGSDLSFPAGCLQGGPHVVLSYPFSLPYC